MTASFGQKILLKSNFLENPDTFFSRIDFSDGDP
jgi:hypothetical protein